MSCNLRISLTDTKTSSSWSLVTSMCCIYTSSSAAVYLGPSPCTFLSQKCLIKCALLLSCCLNISVQRFGVSGWYLPFHKPLTSFKVLVDFEVIFLCTQCRIWCRDVVQAYSSELLSSVLVTGLNVTHLFLISMTPPNMPCCGDRFTRFLLSWVISPRSGLPSLVLSNFFFPLR